MIIEFMGFKLELADVVIGIWVLGLLGMLDYRFILG